MVIRGRTRGNGTQLAKYLMSAKENDDILILDVCGRENANDNDLRHSLLSMSLTSELTKSDKGLYHAQINPAYGEDKQMSIEHWLHAADMLGKELELEDQRRVIVLHTKKDRTHAHVVWERYDHEKKKMKSDSYSRLAQDRARQEMEKLFGQQKTPERNPNRPEMKQRLTELWKQSTTGKDFIAAAKKQGYIIAVGMQRPFMVIDETGRSFDLVRQLEGVKTKEVRDSLRAEVLVGEKEAIASVRWNEKQKDATEKEKAYKKAANDNSRAENTADLSAANKSEAMLDQGDKTSKDRKRNIAENFAAIRQEITQSSQETLPDKKSELASAFADNRHDQLSEDQDKERKRQEFLQKMKQVRETEKNRNQGFEPD